MRYSGVTVTRRNLLQNLYDAEARLVIERSALLLQRPQDGFNGELKTSGSIVEEYVKALLRKHTPQGYDFFSGYIATPESIADPSNLLQFDVIVTDARIPPLVTFEVGDIAVVPIEAVCGVLEVTANAYL